MSIPAKEGRGGTVAKIYQERPAPSGAEDSCRAQRKAAQALRDIADNAVLARSQAELAAFKSLEEGELNSSVQSLTAAPWRLIGKAEVAAFRAQKEEENNS